jgi:hypothetical protein
MVARGIMAAWHNGMKTIARQRFETIIDGFQFLIKTAPAKSVRVENNSTLYDQYTNVAYINSNSTLPITYPYTFKSSAQKSLNHTEPISAASVIEL